MPAIAMRLLYEPEEKNNEQVDSTPAVYYGQIYFGCSNNDVYCVNAQTLQQSSIMDLGSAVISSPAISSTSGLVFAASLDGKIWALDASNIANVLWSYDIPAVENKSGLTIRSSPAIINGQIFIVAGDTNNRYLYCFGD